MYFTHIWIYTTKWILICSSDLVLFGFKLLIYLKNAKNDFLKCSLHENHGDEFNEKREDPETENLSVSDAINLKKIIFFLSVKIKVILKDIDEKHSSQSFLYNYDDRSS